MRNNVVRLTLCALLLALSFPAQAQQTTRVPRIGYLSSRLGIEPREEALLKGLRELGYVEGQNIIIEWRFTKGKEDLLATFAAELVRLKVDCIITGGTPPTHAAKQATRTIPIVMGNVGDPIQEGFIASLAQPGANLTGSTIMSPDLYGKRLELLKEAFPKVSRVAFIWDPANLATAGYLKETDVTAQALKVQLQSLKVLSPDGLQNAFQMARKGRAEALMVVAAGFFNGHRAEIVNLEAKTRLPAMYSDPLFVLAGGLMSYAPDIPEQFRRAAVFVDKILKGTKPTDLPVEQPMKFEFVINLKTAKQIGVTIPQSVLFRADKVIK